MNLASLSHGFKWSHKKHGDCYSFWGMLNFHWRKLRFPVADVMFFTAGQFLPPANGVCVQDGGVRVSVRGGGLCQGDPPPVC